MATSKTKLFCETSFKNGNLNAELTASYQCVLRFFHSTCLKYCACHEKVRQVIRSAAPVTQNHRSKPEDLMLQNATPLRKSAPGPPNIPDEHVSCTAPGTRNSSLQILFKSVNVPRLPTLLELLQNHQVLLVFSKVQNPLRLPHKRHLKRPKMLRTRHTLTLLTSKCASRHNGVLRDRQL